VQSRSRQLILLFLASLFVCVHATHADRLTLRTVLDWKHDADWFGGLSGAEISEDGQKLFVITDNGHLLTTRLYRDDHEITDAEITEAHPLTGPAGTPLTGLKSDAEGLARLPGGDLLVSFEQDHRVTNVNALTGYTEALPAHPHFADFPDNRGLEALAVDQNGTIYAMAESAGNKAGFPLYRFKNESWDIAAVLPRDGAFLPVGADIDDQNRLYVLERVLTPLGFRSRIRRLDLWKFDASPETLLTTMPRQFDNLEALTLWRDSQERYRLILISDDNFSFLLRTQLVEFILQD
jgi:hypothetical protein